METPTAEKKEETTQPIPATPPPVATSSQTDDNTGTRSRMRRRLEQQSKKTIFFTVLGSIVIIALLVAYGPNLIIRLSLLTGMIQAKKDVAEKKEELEFIAAPILDPQFTATNSASVKITGQATGGDQIKLYRNDELADVTKLDKDGTFSFDDVTLEEGENKLKTIATVKEAKSAYSNTIVIQYVKSAPELTVESPQDGDQLSGSDNPVLVKGKTDPNMTVTVNGFVAIIKSDGSFSYTLPLQNSENIIKVVAKDDAGNKTEKEIKVTYSP